MREFTGFTCGIGVSGWLTNYKRMARIEPEFRNIITKGDEEHFASYFTHEDVKRIRSFGMDHIRLGFDQLVVEEYETPGAYREEMLRHIDNCLAWCKEEGLNVLLNLHKGFGAYCDVPEDVKLLENPGMQDRLVALWEMLEDRYHNETHVAFEFLNEIKTPAPECPEWDALCERLIGAMRKKNPDRILMIGSTCQNSLFTVDKLKVYDDPKVVYTFHFYVPYEFCMQRGVLQKNAHFYNRIMPYPGDIERYREYRSYWDQADIYDGFDRMDEKYLYARLKSATDFLEAHPDKILYCGEFGTIVNTDIKSRENWFRDMVRFFKKNGIPYCAWTYLSCPYDGNRFSLVDDVKREFYSETLLGILNGTKLD